MPLLSFHGENDININLGNNIKLIVILYRTAEFITSALTNNIMFLVIDYLVFCKFPFNREKSGPC